MKILILKKPKNFSILTNLLIDLPFLFVNFQFIHFHFFNFHLFIDRDCQQSFKKR